MTLQQLSREYRHSASLLRDRLQLLRRQLSQEQDPERIWHLKFRIAQLTPMLTEMNELAELTARYYERGYYRNERYTMQNIRGPATNPGAAAISDSQDH
jgi:hypothetical protein